MSNVIPFPRRSETGPGFLTTQKLAERWCESPDNIYRLTARELPFFRRGRRRLYRLEDVKRYEAEHTEVA